LHFHPDQDPITDGTTIVLPHCRIDFHHLTSMEQHRYGYSEGFNLSRDGVCIECAFQDRLETIITIPGGVNR
jgi:hypothetical protein